jgi:hypothetical protein
MLKSWPVLSLKRRVKGKEKENLPPKPASQFPNWNSQCENMKERSLYNVLLSQFKVVYKLKVINRIELYERKNSGRLWKNCTVTNVLRVVVVSNATTNRAIIVEYHDYAFSDVTSAEFVILACNGIYDVMEDREAMDLVKTFVAGAVAGTGIPRSIHMGHGQQYLERDYG